MTIIFDFNRTIYNPDTETLMEGAGEVLRALKDAGHTLHLVSKLEAGREDALTRLGIADFFTQIAFVEKKEETMRALIEEGQGEMYVVGDHLHNEIRIGNRHGAKTIWFRNGKFADLEPEGEGDMPWRTVKRLTEVQSVILG